MGALPTRRRFLRGVGAAAIASSAGCAGSDPERERTTGGTSSAIERTETGTGETETATEGRDTATSDRRESDAREAEATFRGGYRRQGYHPGVTVPSEVERAWRVPGVNKGDHTAAKASPVPAPTGDVVVPGDDGTVYALTPDGETSWLAATNPSARGVHGTPTVADGTVYVGAYDGALYAFDVETGRREWRTELGDAIGSSPAYYDGSVYVAVEYSAPSGSLFALDAATGEVEWEDDRLTDHPHSTPAIDFDANRLVVGSNDGSLYAWKFAEREFAWTFDTGRPIKGPVAAFDGSAFFGSWDASVYRVGLETGREEWSFETGDYVMSGPGIDPGTGTVYVGSHDSNVYALDATTGEKRWAYETGGWVIGCPTVTDESVLVGSYDSRLYALDGSSGEKRWHVENAGRVTSEAVPIGGGIHYAERATDDSSGGAYRLEPAE